MPTISRSRINKMPSILFFKPAFSNLLISQIGTMIVAKVNSTSINPFAILLTSISVDELIP